MSLAQVNTALSAINGVEGTLAENISNLILQVRGVYSQIDAKGGPIPANKNTENIASSIGGIQ